MLVLFLQGFSEPAHLRLQVYLVFAGAVFFQALRSSRVQLMDLALVESARTHAS